MPRSSTANAPAPLLSEDTHDFVVNTSCMRRAWRLLRVALGTPSEESRMWSLIALNLAAQFLAGWDAQSFFYYTGTGTSDSDPGMAGCLKSNRCSNATYESYLRTFAWTFVLLVAGVSFFSVTGDMINAMMRRRLGAYLQRRVLSANSRVLYRLQAETGAGRGQHGTPKCENFDQRMTSDLQSFLDGITCAFFGNTGDYLAYPVVFCVSRLWFSFQNVLHPPGHDAFVIAADRQVEIVCFGIVAALLSFLAFLLPVNRIAYLFYTGQRLEGEFRNVHAKASKNAETISLYGGQSHTRMAADSQFGALHTTLRTYYIWQTGLMFTRLLLVISQPSIGYIMLALTGANDSSYAAAFLKQIGDVLEYILNLPAIFARLAFAAGAAHRVGQLMEVLDELTETSVPDPVCLKYSDHLDFQRRTHDLTRSLSCHTAHFDALMQSAINRDYMVAHNDANASTALSPLVEHIELIDVVARPPAGTTGKMNQDCCPSVCWNTDSAAEQQIEMSPLDSVSNSSTPMFNKLNLKIVPGQSVVIMGPSGCGTSSLLRVIAGMWPIESGSLVRPSLGLQAARLPRGGMTLRRGLFFLPQRSYVFPGSLLAQVCYPDSVPVHSAFDAHDLSKRQRALLALSVAGALTLAEPLADSSLEYPYDVDSVVDWNLALTASDRQKLAFARLFFHCPMFALLDQATSALDETTESFMLAKCKELGITMISAAHRHSVVAHHEFVLNYLPFNREWQLVPVGPEDATDSSVAAAAVSLSEDSDSDTQSRTTTMRSASLTVPQISAGLGPLFRQRLSRFLGFDVQFSIHSPGLQSLLGMLLCICILGTIQILVFKYFKTDQIIAYTISGHASSAASFAMWHLAVNFWAAAAQAACAMIGALLALNLHQKFIKHTHSKYMNGNVLHHMNKVQVQEGIDQRLVSDLGGARESLAWLFGNPFAMLSYRLGFAPLSILFIIMIAYAFSIAWSLTALFSISLLLALLVQLFSTRFTASALERRQMCEGKLRAHLMRVKMSAESITFLGGEREELLQAERLLDQVVSARISYVVWASLVVWPSVAMYYWLSNGNYVMATAIQIYTPFQLPSQDIFTVLTFCVLVGKVGMQLVQSVGGFGMLAGYLNRSSEVLECAEALHVDPAADNMKGSTNAHGVIALNNAKIAVGGQVLVDQLSFSVGGACRSAIIQGPSSSSNSAIVRALAGLCPLTEGSLQSPDLLFVVPQSGFACQGSLCANIMFPSVEDCSSSMVDSELVVRLLSILKAVDLEYLADRWGLHATGIEWDEVLSGGELQRLGFARLLFHCPDALIVDEATSELDLPLEAKCMNAIKTLRSTSNQSPTLLSISSQNSLLQFHQKLLQLNNHGQAFESPISVARA